MDKKQLSNKDFIILTVFVFSAFVLAQTGFMLLGAKIFGYTESSLVALTDPSSNLEFKGDISAIVALGSAVVSSFLLIFMLKIKGVDPSRYLGLSNKILPKYLLLFGAIWFVGQIIIGYAEQNFEIFQDDFVDTTVSTSKNKFLLLAGIGIAAPFFEEIFFRGLIYQGLANKWNENIAVYGSALLFSLVHLQYNWAVLLLIFPMGVILAYSKKYSQSLHLPILLHIINNSLAVLFIDSI